MRAVLKESISESFCDLDEERAHIYALLSALFRAPIEYKLIKIIKDCRIENQVWIDLKNAFTDADLDLLDDEFHYLFIGAGTGELLPYCSHYQTGFLMGRPLLEIKEYMQKMGLNTVTKQTYPVDHISGVFEVLRLAIGQLGSSFEIQKEFFGKFVSSWVDEFFDDLKSHEKAYYYSHCAKFGQWFLEVEKRYFGFE